MAVTGRWLECGKDGMKMGAERRKGMASERSEEGGEERRAKEASRGKEKHSAGVVTRTEVAANYISRRNSHGDATGGGTGGRVALAVDAPIVGA
jgi:hypothetical protein